MLISRFLTWIVLLGFVGIGALLLWSAGRRPGAAATAEAIRGANVGLGLARWAFIVLCCATLGLHGYWALFAAGPFQTELRYTQLKTARDQRLRRLSESALRGWVLDRTHVPERALCAYKVVGGRVHRDYPLGPAAAHLLGYTGFVRGDAGIERAFAKQLTRPTSVWNTFLSSAPVGSDIVLSIDMDMQRLAGSLISGRRAAVVVLRVDTGEVLALASSPGFDPEAANDEAAWKKLLENEADQPLLNRALNDYYLPGSTFKMVVAAAALENRAEGMRFTCTAEGFTPPGSGRSIRDDKGEVHGSVDLAKAVEVSCNQYFAQMGLELGRGRLGDVARRFGLHIDDDPESARQSRTVKNFWNTDNSELDAALPVAESRMVLSSRVSDYDVSLQSIGQGYDQTTVMQMAQVAAAIARQDGRRLSPSLEAERPPKLLDAALTPAAAAGLRPMMRAVVERGTASRAFRGCRVAVAGKTGTAQVAVRNQRDPRIDAWFIGFAPFDDPRIAFAVVVEGGGYGGERAAPIARDLVEQADRSGLLNLPRSR